MAQPSSPDVHVDGPLTNISVAYIQAADSFIAGKVFPEIPVEKISDKYFEFPKGDWFRDEAAVRGEAAESAGSGYGVNSSANYNCRTWAFHKDVPARVVANADNPLNPLGEAAEFVTQRILVRMERLWVTSFFSTGLWDTEATPSNLWSSYTSSDPITDLETGVETILEATSFPPNTLVLGYKVWRQLKHHPDIVDRFKYTSSESITTDMLANLLELDRKTKEGHLLRREDVEQAWGGAVNITRTRLLGVASTARQRIPHLETEEVELITTLIREALEELAAGELKQ